MYSIRIQTIFVIARHFTNSIREMDAIVLQYCRCCDALSLRVLCGFIFWRCYWSVMPTFWIYLRFQWSRFAVLLLHNRLINHHNFVMLICVPLQWQFFLLICFPLFYNCPYGNPVVLNVLHNNNICFVFKTSTSVWEETTRVTCSLQTVLTHLVLTSVNARPDTQELVILVNVMVSHIFIFNSWMFAYGPVVECFMMDCHYDSCLRMVLSLNFLWWIAITTHVCVWSCRWMFYHGLPLRLMFAYGPVVECFMMDCHYDSCLRMVLSLNVLSWIAITTHAN